MASRRTTWAMRFAERAGCGVTAVRKLVTLARKAHKAGERYCNVDEPGTGRALDFARIKVEGYARGLGLGTDWPGLWPVFVTVTGENLHLPG